MERESGAGKDWKDRVTCMSDTIVRGRGKVVRVG